MGRGSTLPINFGNRNVFGYDKPGCVCWALDMSATLVILYISDILTSKRGVNDAHSDNRCMYGVQAAQLSDQQEQEE